MINKSLVWFTYIQSLTFCLSNYTCQNCYYHDYDDNEILMGCTLFDGRFLKLASCVLKCIELSKKNHNENWVDCTRCAFQHKNHFTDDCHYTDIMNRIGLTLGKVIS